MSSFQPHAPQLNEFPAALQCAGMEYPYFLSFVNCEND